MKNNNKVQNMNSKLNMNDINNIIAKAHFKCNFFFKWCEETFLWKHVSMKLLEASLSCLHFSLMFSEGEVKSPCCFVSVVSPGKIIPRFYSDISNYFWDTVCTKPLTLGCFLACPSHITNLMTGLYLFENPVF